MFSKKLAFNCIVTVLSVLMLSSLSHAYAISNTSAYLDFDWESTGEFVSWTDTATSMNGADAAYDETETSSYPGWSAPGPEAIATVTENAAGMATSTSSSVSASGHAYSDGSSTGQTSASGTSHIRRSFTVLQSLNEFTLDASYAILQNFFSELEGESAGGYSKVTLSLWVPGATTDSDTQVSIFDETLDNIGEGASNRWSQTISYDFIAGQTYSIEGHVYSSAWAFAPEQEAPVAPVPEPATLFLLGSGLIGIAGTSHKRIFKKK